MASQLPKIVKSVINQRRMLIETKKSNKNPMRCIKYINELNKYISAYQAKWNDDQWRSFVARHMHEIVYLIPSNKAGETTLNNIYENI